MVLVIALEIRDLVGAAWKAYRVRQVKPIRRPSAQPAGRRQTQKGYATS